MVYRKIRESALETHIWLVLAFFVLAGCVTYIEVVDRAASFDLRWIKWKHSIHYYRQHWKVGYGIGHWKTIFFNQLTIFKEKSFFAQAHNDVLQAVFEMGPIFLVILGGYLLQIARRARHVLIKSVLIPLTALVIIFINSQVHFLFHVATTAFIAVTWLAILEIQLRS